MSDAPADKPTIYSKQHDEPVTPLTVRIVWLPDGGIKPTKLWTPNGCCYDIKRVIDMTPLALLKDRGVGLRFHVKAGIDTAAETQPVSEHRLHETYLYLADDWFCGKNIVDERYARNSKEFISVTLDVFSDAQYELVCFRANHTRYIIEKTLSVEPHGSYNAGGVGLLHKVEARLVNDDNDDDPDPERSVRLIAGLYFEINKWFVETTCAFAPTRARTLFQQAACR